MNEGRVLCAEESNHVRVLAVNKQWTEISNRYGLDNYMENGTVVWWHIFDDDEDVRAELDLFSMFHVNVQKLHRYYGTSFFWYARHEPTQEPLWRAILERGLDVNVRDQYDRTIAEHLVWLWTPDNDEPDEKSYILPLFKLLVDHGCSTDKVSPAEFPQLHHYAQRVKARKLAARLAAGCILAGFRRQLGRDLARMLALRVWETRREREVWQPVEQSDN